MTELDWRKQPIEVGCTIVYPTTASSSVTMNEAIVAEIYYDQQPRYSHSTDPTTGRRVTNTSYVQVPRLRVQKTIEKSYSISKAQQGKLTKIDRVDRVTVVVPASPDNCNEMGCQYPRGHLLPSHQGYNPNHSWEVV